MFSCTQRTAQGKDFELILTVKMETRHPAGGPFGREFLVFVIIAELWRPGVARPGNVLSNFCVFIGKTTPYGNIFKILFRTFSPPQRLTLLYSNVVKCVRREIAEIVRYLPHNNKTKFRNPLKLSLLRGSCPKSAKASRQNLAHNVLNIIQIGSLLAEL